MGCAVVSPRPARAKGRGADALDFAPISIKSFGEIGHFWLDRGIFEGPFRRAKTAVVKIFSVLKCNFWEIERGREMFRARASHIAVFDGDLRPTF